MNASQHVTIHDVIRAETIFRNQPLHFKAMPTPLRQLVRDIASDIIDAKNNDLFLTDIDGPIIEQAKTHNDWDKDDEREQII